MKPSRSGNRNDAPPSSDRAATSVFIIDDHAGYRSAASDVVSATAGFVLVGSAASTAEALTSLDRLPVSPDLILMDVNLGPESGIDTTRAVLAIHPTTKVILVTTLEPDELPPGYHSCGADGYLFKTQLSTSTLAGVWAGAYDWAP